MKINDTINALANASITYRSNNIRSYQNDRFILKTEKKCELVFKIKTITEKKNWNYQNKILYFLKMIQKYKKKI